MIWLLVAVPGLNGALLVLLGPRCDRLAPSVGVFTTLASGGLVLAVGTSAEATVPFLYGLGADVGMDGLSYVLALTVCVVTACVFGAVPAQVQARRGRLSGWLLLFLSAVLLTLVARSLLPLLGGWELMGAASYLLIAHEHRSTRSVGSATTALLVTRALDLGLYLAAGALLAGSGSLSLAELPRLTGWPLHLAALGVALACLGKAAQLPVSFWLSRAMDGPSPVSALLHSAAMVAMGGYLLLRTSALLVASGWADQVVAWTGVLTAVTLGLVAVAQTDVKQALAASTASQLGFVVLAAGVGAVGPGAAQLVAHASVKALLFLVAGTWLHQLHTRDVGALRGVLLRLPALGSLGGLGLLALAGLPPFALWGSKDAVLGAVEQRSLPLYLVALLAAALSTVYAVRLLVLLGRGAPHSQPAQPIPGKHLLPMLPLGLGALTLAGIALPPLDGRFADLLGADLHVSLGGLLVSTLLVLAVAVSAWRRGDAWAAQAPAALHNWLYLEAGVHLLVVQPLLRLSQGCAAFDDRFVDGAAEAGARGGRRVAAALGWFDDHVVDGSVRATTTGSLGLARLSGAVDDRGVDRGASGIAKAVQRLGRGARRPQTGQLHDYYGQAAAVLVAAIALLLLLMR